MGYPTPIEWTDATWNPIGGCSIKSPGCAPCYAQQLAGTRLKSHPLYAGTTTMVKGKPVFNGLMTASDDEDVWTWPLRWRGAKEPKLGPGMPSLIFVGDMSDLFHEKRQGAIIDRVIGTVIHSKHIGQLLTKRPGIMAGYFRQQVAKIGIFSLRAGAMERLWLGFSAERQKEFDERWPHIRRLSELGFTIFLSYEPAIGPLNLPADFLALGNRAWVIAGGTSGNEAIPAHPAWFRHVRDQCKTARVAYFFKQWGEWAPSVEPWKLEATGPACAFWEPHDLRWVHFPQPPRQMARFGLETGLSRVGKRAAGRLLDGVEHNEFPRVAT
jgi:protein gp37